MMQCFVEDLLMGPIKYNMINILLLLDRGLANLSDVSGDTYLSAPHHV